jgi:hypothetical protein
MLGNALRAEPSQKMKALLLGCYPTHMYSRGIKCGTDEKKKPKWKLQKVDWTYQ